jgi:hypothetical protein
MGDSAESRVVWMYDNKVPLGSAARHIGEGLKPAEATLRCGLYRSGLPKGEYCSWFVLNENT